MERPIQGGAIRSVYGFVLETLENRRLLSAAPGGAFSSPPLGQRPDGAAPDDINEFMAGSVYVTVVLMESDGGVDLQTENWTLAEISQVKSQVTQGLTWWENMYSIRGFSGTLDFQIDFTNTNTPFNTDYEPIIRSHNDEFLWRDQFQIANGFAPGQPGLKQFNNAQRIAHNTDWAYTIFIVDSSYDAIVDDGLFTGGWSAYASYGGPKVVMTYDNGGYGINKMGQILRTRQGISSMRRMNMAAPLPPALLEITPTVPAITTHRTSTPSIIVRLVARPQVDSIMWSSSEQDRAYLFHTSSPTSLQMVGWKDSDGDHIIDVLDQPLTLTGASGSFNPSTNIYTFSGKSAVTKLTNQNPNSNKNSITLNEVDRLQYRIDGSPWTNINGVPYHVSTKTFSNVQVNMPASWRSIQFRTRSDESGVVSPIFTDTGLIIVDDSLDMTMFKPMGWADKMIVSTNPGNNVDIAAGQVYANQDIYLDFVVENSGNAYIGSSNTHLYIDGVPDGNFFHHCVGCRSYAGFPRPEHRQALCWNTHAATAGGWPEWHHRGERGQQQPHADYYRFEPIRSRDVTVQGSRLV